MLENLDLPSLDRAALEPRTPCAPRSWLPYAASSPSIKARASESRLESSSCVSLRTRRSASARSNSCSPIPDVNEIMVVDPHTIFVERRGKMQLTALKFTDDDSVRAAIERIVTPLGRRIDESTPLVDARLRDGSRVNAVIPPLALRGPCITIRKFAKDPLRMSDLLAFGSVSNAMARFLERSVKVKKNLVISGGTGSGKTTLLNVLSGAIPAHERVVTVEDAAELQARSAARRLARGAPAEPRGKGRVLDPRSREERAAHAAGSHRGRGVPRRRSDRHVAGHEHRSRGLDDHHARQQPQGSALPGWRRSA